MGAEARCTLTIGATTTEGKASLETDALNFRGGGVRLTVPFKEISAVDAARGALRVTYGKGVAVFAIGDAASRWAQKIRNPPGRLDKLGVKPGHVVVVAGVADRAFAAEMRARGATIARRASGRADLVFYGAESRAALARLAGLRKHLKPNGALWVVRPRGADCITERDVMDAGKQAGLVDVKVVRFSETHTAEKFVVPVSRR